MQLKTKSMKKKIRLFMASIITLSLLGACTDKKKTEESAPLNTNSTESLLAGDKTIQGDSYQTSKGNLKVFVVGHASLLFEFNGKNIYVDPYSKVADYTQLPKADFIFLTHEHSDHLDSVAINNIKTPNTKFIVSLECNTILSYGQVMANGDKVSLDSLLTIEAVPAYNIQHKNEQGNLYHPKGRGNGYLITFGDKTVYVAADTENIPEMDALKGKIDIAFLPKNLPYTMTDEMFIDAAKKIAPTYLYPYHMNEFDENKIGKALEESNIKLMIRPMSNL